MVEDAWVIWPISQRKRSELSDSHAYNFPPQLHARLPVYATWLGVSGMKREDTAIESILN